MVIPLVLVMPVLEQNSVLAALQGVSAGVCFCYPEVDVVISALINAVEWRVCPKQS
jgi:hypothetical protein